MKVDVDQILGKDKLELTVNGTVYTITDIPFNVYLEYASKLKEPESNMESLRDIVSKLLGVDKDKLGSIGPRAANIILEKILEWLTGGKASGGDGRENPK